MRKGRVPRRRWDELRADVIARLGAICLYCGCDCSDAFVLTVDHLVPLSLRGEDRTENLIVACKTCNTRRGSMPIDDFLALLVRIFTDREALELIDRCLVAGAAEEVRARDQATRSAAAVDESSASLVSSSSG